MSDLISRDKLLEDIRDYQMDMSAKATAIRCIEGQKAVEERLRGKWLYNGSIKEWECSECHSSISLSDDRNAHPNFCPQCGVDMRKKVE